MRWLRSAKTGVGLARIRIGEASVDFAARIIESGGKAVSVEPKVMAVLQMLADRAGEVVTREELIADIWDVRFGGDERLSRAISILRGALGDSGGEQSAIQTIPKQGYRLTAQVCEAGEAAPSSGTESPPLALVPHSIAVLPF